MNRSSITFLTAALLGTLSSLAAAQPKADPGLVMDWAPGAAKVEGTTVTDGTGTIRAAIVGQLAKVTIGPGEGTMFDGATSWLILSDDIAANKKGLPTRDFTVAAWVNLAATREYGSIIGAVQDNGDFEKGWMLGYTTDAFYLALSTTGADDGDGKLTYMKGATKITPGKWYYVVGTYDGATMRLHVNGKLDAESKVQSGDILYPPKAKYTIGVYLDDDEKHPMHGAIADLKLHSRALSNDVLAQQYSAGLALASWEPPASAEQGFIVKPYVQFATLDSIRILWETRKPSTGYVEYGEALPMTQRAAASTSQTMQEVTLTGLKPQQQYLYRVVLDDAGAANAGANGATGGGPTGAASAAKPAGDILTFQTAVLPDSPYAFCVIGDTQKNAPVIAKLQKFAYSLRPNFEIHCGDVVDVGPDKSEWTNEFLAGSNILMSRAPVYPCIGNHEKNHSLFYQYFSLPNPEYCYTYTYGNAQFFVLDTNKPVGPGSEQWDWLDKELAKSTARWKFCYHHHPVYSSDENDFGDTYKGPSNWGDPKIRPLADLYEKHHVDIAFCGHIHLYERTWPVLQGKAVEEGKGGVIYITSGGGGGGLEAVAPTRTWFQRRSYIGHHICYVTVNGGTLQLQAFDLEGRLFDQMELKKQ